MAKQAVAIGQETSGRKGFDWKNVKAASLSEASRKMYQEYVEAFAKASEMAAKLKTAVQTEWSTNYPDGIEGRVVVFNAIGGVLLYTMKDKEKAKEAKTLDMEDGDDVFSFAKPTAPLQTVRGGKK